MTSETDPRLGVGLGLLVLRIARVGLTARDLALLSPRSDLLQARLRLARAEASAPPADFGDALRRRRAGAARSELVYGETPVWTARALLRWAGLGPTGRLLDVGAGRGQVLLAARWLGAEAVGIEIAATHVAWGGPIVSACGAELRVGDGAKAPLDGVTHVFCAWTTWSAAARGRLAGHLTGLAPGARLVTLGGPLEAPGFLGRGRRAVLVPWGIEQACLHERVSR